MQKHKNLIFFVCLLLLMTYGFPLVLLTFVGWEVINANQAQITLFLSVPFIYFASILLAIKWLRIHLNLRLKGISPYLITISSILLLFLYIFQTTLDMSFLNYLIENKLKFLRLHLVMPKNLYGWLDLIIPLLFAPILEELLFRKIIFEKLLEEYKPQIAIAITSILFALMHMDINGLLAYLLIAFVYTYVYYLTRNIWLTIFIHFVFNLLSRFTRLEVYDSNEPLFYYGISAYIISILGLIITLRIVKRITHKKA